MDNVKFDFSGQTVVISGGTKGIGRAAAEQFVAAGAKVVCAYGGDDEAAQLLANRFPDDIAVRKLDVADAEACKEFWRSLEESGVVPPVLVNSAGIRKDSVLAMMPEEDWRRVLDVNLGGIFNMCKYAVQTMSGARYGRIINITSPSGKYGVAGQANYAASKAGMEALTKSLSKEVARRNVTVNCVSPGFIDTDFIRDLPEVQAKEYKASVPLKRFGHADEVAAAILFLASREASYITGATLEVTGGL